MPLYDPTDSNVGAVTIAALSLCLCSCHYIEDNNGPENVVSTGYEKVTLKAVSVSQRAFIQPARWER